MSAQRNGSNRRVVVDANPEVEWQELAMPAFDAPET
jgi:hypothetical protein